MRRAALPAFGDSIMRRFVPSALTAAVLSVLCPIPGQPATEHVSAAADVERLFDSAIDPAMMSAWMRRLASAPNQVGSAHDSENAGMLLGLYKKWGWDAHIEQFQVLYPTPISETLELLTPGRFKATLTEPVIQQDEQTWKTAGVVPAYVAYQGDGDVTAPLVYVNYGTQDDYDTLRRMGIGVRGKIVIARYGSGWRGLKPKLAAEHGAIGCIIYSDPGDDGYAVADAYPYGPARPAAGFQRGSVGDTTLYPGDPLTPGIAATADAPRLKIAEAPSILKIPVLPISHGDAQHFLAALTGPVVPYGWEGALPITYHVGAGKISVHLVVKSDWRLVTIRDIVAVMKGSTFPDQWVLRGNHYDAWVFGATDPMSGQVALMAEARAIGELAQHGWRPKRTIVYVSWDAEEPTLTGSTEWVEAHAAELKQKAIAYINSDSNGRGFLNATGSPSLEHLVNRAAARVTDPETGVSVLERKRAQLRLAGSGPDADDDDRELAEIAANPARDIPLGAPGSGTDYTAFLDHLGIPAVDLEFAGEGDIGGVYHSAYDTWSFYTRYADPGFRYGPVLAKMAGHIVLRLADAPVPPMRFGDLADAVSGYLDDVKKLADERRETAAVQAKLLSAHVFRLAADPNKVKAPPAALKPVPRFDFARMESAVAHLRGSASSYDAAVALRAPHLPPQDAARLFVLISDAEQALAPEAGLPGRPWYRNLVYAPGRLTGYSAKTLPGIREAIEEQRWKDAKRYIAITAAALDAAADRLDSARRVVLPNP